MLSYSSLLNESKLNKENNQTKKLLPKKRKYNDLNSEIVYVSNSILESLKNNNLSITLDLSSENFESHRDLVSEEQYNLLNKEIEKINEQMKQYIKDQKIPRISFNSELRQEHRKTIVQELLNDNWVIYQCHTDYCMGGLSSVSSFNFNTSHFFLSRKLSDRILLNANTKKTHPL